MKAEAIVVLPEFVQLLLMCVRTVCVLTAILIHVQVVRGAPILPSTGAIGVHRETITLPSVVRKVIILVIREPLCVLQDSREAAAAVVQAVAVLVQAADAVEDN